MLLAFKTSSLEKIRDGKKNTTIRGNPWRWHKWYYGCFYRSENAILQVYRGNPRNKGTFVAETEMIRLRILPGRHFTRPIASRDGFTKRRDLIYALMDLYGISYGDVEERDWAVIRFDPDPIVRVLKGQRSLGGF